MWRCSGGGLGGRDPIAMIRAISGAGEELAIALYRGADGCAGRFGDAAWVRSRGRFVITVEHSDRLNVVSHRLATIRSALQLVATMYY